MTYRDAFSYRDMPPPVLSYGPRLRRLLRPRILTVSCPLPGRRLFSASPLLLHSQIMQNEVLVHERVHSNVRTNVCISNKASGRSRGTGGQGYLLTAALRSCYIIY